MAAYILSPQPSDTRSIQADWAELQALLHPYKGWTSGDLYGVLDFLEDDAADTPSTDEETGDQLDESILESHRSRVLDMVFDELQYRKRILGKSYPFSINVDQLQIELVTDVTSVPGRTVYLFCLLVTAVREKMIRPLAMIKNARCEIPGLFQICACLAAGGYFAGDVVSFGFPRPKGDNFLSALRDTYGRFGAGEVVAAIRPGQPDSTKDEGIDVIAWKDHPDRLPGKIYILGQSASGKNWKKKSVVEHIPQFHGWFSESPSHHCMPSMFIPFTLHQDLDDDPSISFNEMLKNKFLYEERKFGIVFDRCRVAHFADACLQMDDQTTRCVDGLSQFSDVETWVNDTCKVLSLTELA